MPSNASNLQTSCPIRRYVGIDKEVPSLGVNLLQQIRWRGQFGVGVLTALCDHVTAC